MTKDDIRLMQLVLTEIQCNISLKDDKHPPLRFVADSKSLAFSSSFSSLLIFSLSSFSMTAFDSSTSAKCSWVALLAKIKSDKQVVCCDWFYFKSIKMYLYTLNFTLYDLQKFMLIRKLSSVRKALTTAYHLCLEKSKNMNCS